MGRGEAELAMGAAKQCDRLFTPGAVNWSTEQGVMVMILYLDLLIGLNFIVDLLLLLGTNRLSGFQPGMGRAVMAAALGAVYAAGCMIPRLSFLGSSLWRIVFLGIMGMIAFGLNRSAWRRTGIFLLLSMAMGGIALGLEKTGFFVLILSAGGVWILSRIGFAGGVGGKEYIPVTITEGERTLAVIALKDTGNTLRDPVTGEQVLILGPDAAERLLHISRDQLAHPQETIMAVREKGLRLIPYSTVGNPGGMLLAKKFRNVKAGGKQLQAVVAFAPERIGSGGGYQALAGGML